METGFPCPLVLPVGHPSPCKSRPLGNWEGAQESRCGGRDRRRLSPHVAFNKILVVVTAGNNWGEVDDKMGFSSIRLQGHLKESKHKNAAGLWVQTRTSGT